MVKELKVYYEQELVGTIVLADSGLMSFEYAKRWQDVGFKISNQLPLAENFFAPEKKVAHNFFANLLPEQGARQRIVRDLKITDTDFNLLARLGQECAGALTILEPGVVPKQEVSYQKLSAADLSKIISRKGSYFYDISNAENPRLSLAGAQDKTLIFYENEKFYLPQATSPSSHIIKYELPEYNNIPLYEFFLTKLAAKLDLPVVELELKKCKGEFFLLIERYDRVKKNGRLQRLHQEDFCQALNISHANKYEADGGPGFAACFNFLKKNSMNPIVDAENILSWQIFNFLAGNSDGHAKNISLLYMAKGQVKLAPFYDLVCTRAVPRIDQRLAMAIGGELDPGKITARHWQELAKECELKAQYVLDLAKNMATELLESVDLVWQELESGGEKYPALQRVKAVIHKQCNKVLKQY